MPVLTPEQKVAFDKRMKRWRKARADYLREQRRIKRLPLSEQLKLVTSGPPRCGCGFPHNR